MTPGIPSYAVTSDNVLLWCDGLHPMMRWDGMSGAPVTAGVIPPVLAPVLAASGSGEIDGTYYAYLRFLDQYGNYSDPSPISDPLTASTNETITYTSVQTPTEAKVVRRQLLRNTAGQASAFYVDVDTDDLTSTTFASTQPDTLLGSQPAVPLFDSLNLPYMASHAVPPSHKTVVAVHRDRLFLSGDYVCSDGGVVVVNGSTSVSGIATNWTAEFVGRYLYVDGAGQSYLIDSVDVGAQTLTLDTAYGGPTGPYERYAIRAEPGESRLVYYSNAGEPESVPAFNALSLPADDDIITGLLPMGSWLLITERNHIYRLTYKDSPSQDGAVFLAIDRGCVNQNCWALLEGKAYLLDEAGVYRFDGGSEVEPLSDPIQDLFETSPGKPGDLRIHWAMRRYFHCCYYPAQNTIRFFVALQGDCLPRHALCLELRRKRWWVEAYPGVVGASRLGRLLDQQKVFLGVGESGTVTALGEGNLDLADPTAGTTRGQVTAADPLTLTDALAHFHPSYVNCPLTVTAGRGEGQQRRVVVVTSPQSLTLDRPWSVLPDTTSTYSVGGVAYHYRNGSDRWVISEQLRPRRLDMMFEPTLAPATASLRCLRDRDTSGRIWQSYVGPEFNRLASTPGSPDLVADLTKSSGHVWRRMDGRRDLYIDGNNLLSLDLQGVANIDPVVINSLQVDGAQE
jgi:hypothetical protein